MTPAAKKSPRKSLEWRAANYGVQRTYLDCFGKLRSAPDKAVEAVLDALELNKTPAQNNSPPPELLFSELRPELNRSWGIFVPVYALRSEASLGVGDLGDLIRLAGWLKSLGGAILGILPLHAIEVGKSLSISPYASVSRLFYNELYLSLRAIPELLDYPEARKTLKFVRSSQLPRRLNHVSLVDYRQSEALKRSVLSELIDHVYSGNSLISSEYQAWLMNNPDAVEYGKYRAVTAHLGPAGPAWNENLMKGEINSGDYKESTARYHTYVQWAMNRQLTRLAAEMRKTGLALYLDLALGSQPGGYDVWRYSDLFVKGVSVGAPPDPLALEGQNWGFPPLHPMLIKNGAGEFYRQVLRRQMQFAGLLRLDHVMSLHRLYLVPGGFSARDGCYVEYPADYLYNLVATESAASGCEVVGEDLGTVPTEIRAEMARRKMPGMWVLPFEIDATTGLRAIPTGCLACLNTHDMPPFAAFWENCDEDRRRIILESAGARTSDTSVQAGLKACINYLATSDARYVIINLEDLWFETEQQNHPGSTSTKLNWRRKTRLTLEDLFKDARIRELLTEFNMRRKGI